jgi:hypothetical protein
MTSSGGDHASAKILNNGHLTQYVLLEVLLYRTSTEANKYVLGQVRTGWWVLTIVGEFNEATKTHSPHSRHDYRMQLDQRRRVLVASK